MLYIHRVVTFVATNGGNIEERERGKNTPFVMRIRVRVSVHATPPSCFPCRCIHRTCLMHTNIYIHTYMNAATRATRTSSALAPSSVIGGDR